MKRVLLLIAAYLLSSPVFAAEIFSCSIAKSGKWLQLSENDGALSYSYGAKGQAPELAITLPLGHAELYAWEGIGRYQNYSITLPRGEHQYRIFKTYDSIAQSVTTGVAVEKADAVLAELHCKPKTVQGDLEKYVLKQKGL